MEVLPCLIIFGSASERWSVGKFIVIRIVALVMLDHEFYDDE